MLCPKCNSPVRKCATEPECRHCTSEECGWCGHATETHERGTVTVYRVFTLPIKVTIPTTCPKCAVDLTQPLALVEYQLDPAYQECSPPGGASDDWGEVSHDGDTITQGYGCAKCGADLVAHDLVELNSPPLLHYRYKPKLDVE